MSVDYATRHRFTVEEFHRMGDAGVFSHDDRVELINGEIFEMAPIGSEHAGCVRDIDRWLQRLLGDEALVSAQQPLKIDDDGEPIPDVAVLRPRRDGYRGAHPRAGDALLVIEVADSSVVFDRNVKRRLYAGAGVPEYWVVDLPRQSVAVYGAPLAGDYSDEREYPRSESWTSQALAGRTIFARDVLGPALRPNT